MRRAFMLSLPFLLRAQSLLADHTAAGQAIPNPNQDRLGMPAPPVPSPSPNPNQHRARQVKASHAEALRDADELYTRAAKLREQLMAAGEYIVPVSAIADAQRIEKLAHKIRGQLKN